MTNVCREQELNIHSKINVIICSFEMLRSFIDIKQNFVTETLDKNHSA